ncbi:hypothetical protein B2G88_06740 [Natronolimnobius baerhuensis]|uniref:Uncharacterized protein n=1 Tax=Natronolimnobius baerhuensis TaxID=253108 RepID=A0A202E796_9EURY|nr:hypothetical protein B2G88_06740 [Natronolimnobius baerhuensis]
MNATLDSNHGNPSTARIYIRFESQLAHLTCRVLAVFTVNYLQVTNAEVVLLRQRNTTAFIFEFERHVGVVLPCMFQDSSEWLRINILI